MPPQPGLTSALGLMFVDLVHDLSRGLVIGQEGTEVLREGEGILSSFEQELVELLHSEGAEDKDIDLKRYLDMRYVGQVHTIRVPIGQETLSETVLKSAVEYFHAAHEREYRYSRPEWDVEVAVLRVEGRGARVKPRLEVKFEGGSAATTLHRRVYLEELGWQEVPLYSRQDLPEAATIGGPAIIEEYDSTTFLPAGSSAMVDAFGNLVIDPRAGNDADQEGSHA